MNDASVAAGLPDGWCGLLTTREDVSVMLKMDEDIDLIIPRGSNAFVRYIMENSRIPVLGHSDGVCHVYVDADCDAQMAARIVVDAKTQYPAACNAAEMLLSSQRTAEPAPCPQSAKALAEAGVTLRADERARAALYAGGHSQPKRRSESDWGREYLALDDGGVHTVDSHRGGDCLSSISMVRITRTASLPATRAAAGKFFALVDSAGVYQNCSTRFADGYRYGFRRGGRHFDGQNPRARPDGAGGALLLQVHSARPRRYCRRILRRGGSSFTHQKLL